MHILSNIESEDLKEKLNQKQGRFNTFTAVSTSQTVTAASDYDGRVYYFSTSSLTLTLAHDALPVGGCVTVIGPDSGECALTTSDGGFPGTTLSLLPGQHVDCIWSGSQWFFKGNFGV